MMQNSPIRTPGPMTASDETTAGGAITADGSMAMNSYDKRRGNQTGRRRHGGAGPGAEGAEMAEERSYGRRSDIPAWLLVPTGVSAGGLAGVHLGSAAKGAPNLTGLGG